MKHSPALLLALLAFLSVPAIAATVDQSRATGPNPEISVEAILGSIRVVGWDRNEVRVTGTLGSGIEGLEMQDIAPVVRGLHHGGARFDEGPTRNKR